MLPNPMQTPPIGGMAPMNTTPPMNMMPPMPPMGKMPPMEMNLDPMARQNFNNLMSGIQSQSIIPPMPMRMNEGGPVNPLMALIQGLGRLFGFGGGQEPSRGMSFGDAFAKARREGKKVFEYNGKMYTTEIKEEEDARIAQEEEDSRKARRYTGPTIPAMEDPYDEVMASTPTMGNEFDVQRKASEPRGMDPRLEMIMNSLSQMQPQVRQGDEFQMAAAADAPNVKIPGVKYDPNDEDYGAYFDYVRSQTTPGLTDTSGELGSLLKSSPEPIEAQLNALMNISNQQPNLPTGLTEGVKPLGLGEKIQSLLQNLQRMGLSDELSSSIGSKIRKLNMKEGGSVTDAIARLENGGDAESESFQQRLEKFFGSGILDNLSEEDKEFLKIGGGVTALNLTAMPVIKSLIDEKGRLNKRFFNPEYDFRGRELEDKAFKKYMKEMGLNKDFYKKPAMSFGEFYKNLPDSEKTLDKKKILMNMLKRGLGTFLKGSGIVAGFSPSKIAQQERFVDGKDMLFKNQGGVVPIQGYQPGGFVQDFFDSVKEQFNKNIPTYDSNKYDSASEQAKAMNVAAGNAMGLSPGSFIGATEYTYPIGDRLLTFSAGNENKGFGGESNPSYSADRYSQTAKGTPGGPKPDIAGMTPEEAQMYISNMAPTTKGFTGDYSNLDTFKNYTFSDPNFQFDDFKQAAEIAGYGQENKLASDKNIASGAAIGTYRQEGEDVVDDDVVVDDTNLGTDTTNTGTTMTSTATTPISPFAQIEQATVVPSTRTVDASFNPSFTPLASSDIYNPNFLTDMPDFSTLSIDPSQSAAVDLQKFLDIDEDKTAPKAFTPDTTNITDIMKASGYQQGGAVSPGLNMAIDKFISAYS